MGLPFVFRYSRNTHDTYSPRGATDCSLWCKPQGERRKSLFRCKQGEKAVRFPGTQEQSVLMLQSNASPLRGLKTVQVRLEIAIGKKATQAYPFLFSTFTGILAGNTLTTSGTTRRGVASLLWKGCRGLWCGPYRGGCPVLLLRWGLPFLACAQRVRAGLPDAGTRAA